MVKNFVREKYSSAKTFRWLSISSVKKFHLLKVTKFFKNFVVFNRQNFNRQGTTFTDNHFYKYICFKYYTVWNQFFFKGSTKVFYIQIWFQCGTLFLFFLIRSMVCRKKLFIEKVVFCWRLCKNHWITYCTHMTSHAIWVDEIARVISMKKINKGKAIWKNIFVR